MPRCRRDLLKKTEDNKEIRAVEQQNKYCLRQAELGIGDCAGLPMKDLKAAVDESNRKMAEKRALIAEGGGVDSDEQQEEAPQEIVVEAPQDVVVVEEETGSSE